MNKKTIILLVFTILLISGIASAQDDRLPLNPPPGYFGSIIVNGQPANAGTTITAKIGGEERGSITTAISGVYGDNPGPTKLWITGYQNETGSPVTFYVSGVAAQQTAQLSGAGIISRADLTFVGVPTSTATAGAPGGGPGGGGGSSSGGGGGGTEEPFDNILKYLTIYGNLIANTSVPYNFSSAPELDIYEILAVGKENENDVSIRMELLKGTSKLVKAPPDGTVYKNINIWVSSKKIQEARIRFRVDNSWITSNGLASGDMKMYRWDGSQWGQLETSEITNDASYRYYEAKTFAFSPFAISGSKSAAATTPGVTPEATKALEVSGALPTTAPASNFAIIIGVIIFLVVIAAFVRYFSRK